MLLAIFTILRKLPVNQSNGPRKRNLCINRFQLRKNVRNLLFIPRDVLVLFYISVKPLRGQKWHQHNVPSSLPEPSSRVESHPSKRVSEQFCLEPC